VEDLPPVSAVSRPGEPGGEGIMDDWPPLPAGGLSLVDLEKKVIERALRLKGGNITQAAAYLNVPRHILVYRLEKYGIRRDG
jgi:two-component system NtrC family response regulator